MWLQTRIVCKFTSSSQDALLCNTFLSVDCLTLPNGCFKLYFKLLWPKGNSRTSPDTWSSSIVPYLTDATSTHPSLQARNLQFPFDTSTSGPSNPIHYPINWLVSPSHLHSPTYLHLLHFLPPRILSCTTTGKEKLQNANWIMSLTAYLSKILKRISIFPWKKKKILKFSDVLTFIYLCKFILLRRFLFPLWTPAATGF